VTSVPVLLSTSSCFPEPLAGAFEIASTLGYDGLEVMVFTDPMSQDADALGKLAREYSVPVRSIHAPCLLLTQRVWGREPWGKVHRSLELAKALDADVVVLHPPFRWQREYATDFVEEVNRLSRRSGIPVAIENMYPWRVRGREVGGYLPHAQQTGLGYAHTTLDLSHTATSGIDPLVLMSELGDTLRHIHLADGSGSARDEHLVPGRGIQPCAAVLARGKIMESVRSVAVEVGTRFVKDRDQRLADLGESLNFARQYL
jgi:sugar phosphate isomerase/epimerase